MISFKVNKREHELIAEIADRASAIARQADNDYPTVEAMMDVTATHANCCRLKLKELLSAEKFDFAHDVFGIRRHINRKTGQLEDCFVPRYAERQGV